MDAAPETIGQRLRRLRIERSLSQRALSSRGVSYAYISRIEAGARTPSVKALRLLAERLGVSVEYLETGRDLAPAEDRELRLREAELELRLSDDPAVAEQTLRELVLEAQHHGDAAVTMRALAALGLTAERRADHAEAVALLEQALATGGASILDSWDVYRTLSRAYAASGRAVDAVRLLEGCLAELDRVAPYDDVAYVRVATYLSYALSDAGDLPRAREVVAGALRRANGITDAATRIRLYWSYARIALTEQKPRVALEHLRRAVNLLETTEDTRELARAHLFWAEILTFDSRPSEAMRHLELAQRLLGPTPDREDLCLLRVEQARAAAENGSSAEGERLAREALELIGDGDATERGTALWALGQSLLDQEDAETGIATLMDALELLEAQQAWYEAANVARRLGNALRKNGRESEALDVLERAVAHAGIAEGAALRHTTSPALKD